MFHRNRLKGNVPLEEETYKTCHVVQYESKLLSLEARRHRKRHTASRDTARRRNTGKTQYTVEMNTTCELLCILPLRFTYPETFMYFSCFLQVEGLYHHQRTVVKMRKLMRQRSEDHRESRSTQCLWCTHIFSPPCWKSTRLKNNFQLETANQKWICSIFSSRGGISGQCDDYDHTHRCSCIINHFLGGHLLAKHYVVLNLRRKKYLFGSCYENVLELIG